MDKLEMEKEKSEIIDDNNELQDDHIDISNDEDNEEEILKKLEDDGDDDEPFDKDEEDEEVKALSRKIDDLEGSRRQDIFPRTETKHEFASGILNNNETKKICNLQEYEISDLVEKRKFVNFLSYFGWDGLSDRLLMNVHDVEDYSLSKDGRLLDSVFIEKSKSQNTQIEKDMKKEVKR